MRIVFSDRGSLSYDIVPDSADPDVPWRSLHQSQASVLLPVSRLEWRANFPRLAAANARVPVHESMAFHVKRPAVDFSCSLEHAWRRLYNLKPSRKREAEPLCSRRHIYLHRGLRQHG